MSRYSGLSHADMMEEADRNHHAWYLAGNEVDFKQAVLWYLRAAATQGEKNERPHDQGTVRPVPR